MAQNENYSQVDLRVGTEEQFNAKVGTLPAGTLFGVTDSTVSKADLSTDLKNEINGKYTKPSGGIPETDLASGVQASLAKADSALQSHQTVKLESGTNNGTLKLTVNGIATDNIAVKNLGSAAFTATSNYATAAQGAKADSAVQKPSNPTTESAITINSSGTISTKPLASITGKTEVAISSIQPNDDSSEVLWINPDGNSKYESLQDSTPTANSSNYVASGGVKSYVDTATSILKAYPVGAIYISYNSTDPGDLFGGSWTQLENRFLLGAGTTYAARSMGGEATHTLTTSEIPDHWHGY